MNTHTQLHVASKVLNLTLEEINNIAQNTLMFVLNLIMIFL